MAFGAEGTWRGDTWARWVFGDKDSYELLGCCMRNRGEDGVSGDV